MAVTMGCSSPIMSWVQHVNQSSPFTAFNLATSRENMSSGIFDQVRFKPACSATQTSYNLETLDKASIHIILSKQRTTKVLIRLRGCAGWFAPLLFAYGIRHIFARPGPTFPEANQVPRQWVDRIFQLLTQVRLEPTTFSNAAMCYNCLTTAPKCDEVKKYMSWSTTKPTLEWVFMKCYGPNICLPLKITWKQDASQKRGIIQWNIYGNLPKVNQVIYTMDTICVPNIMILAQALLQIFCWQGFIGLQCISRKREIIQPNTDRTLPKIQVIYTLDTICEPNIMILVQAVLQIFCWQGSIGLQYITWKKEGKFS